MCNAILEEIGLTSWGKMSSGMVFPDSSAKRYGVLFFMLSSKSGMYRKSPRALCGADVVSEVWKNGKFPVNAGLAQGVRILIQTGRCSLLVVLLLLTPPPKKRKRLSFSLHIAVQSTGFLAVLLSAEESTTVSYGMFL